jgi:hemerythrin-like domain-containing protein
MEFGFEPLVESHAQLRRLLQEHQEALVTGDRYAARTTFERYARAMRAHLGAEDDLLLPRYRDLVPPAVGGGIDLFSAEHRKVELFLEAMEDDLLTCPDNPLPASQRVHWIEEQARFKHLLEHHHQREETVLFPALDACLASDERDELVAALLARQVEAGLWEPVED